MSDQTPILLPPAEATSDRPKWGHWTWWLQPKVALPPTLFVLLLASPFLVRNWHLSQVPDIADPFDVEAFLSETVDDTDNAFVDYHAAQALLVPESSLTTEQRNELDWGWEKTSAGVQAWVDANSPALNRWRIGTEKTDAIDGDLRNDPWLSLPEVTPARDLSQLAWLQGEREQSAGHLAEAWRWYRAVMRYSRHVAQRKDCIGRTLGSSLHASTAKRIIAWAGDPRTTAEQLQIARHQLDEDFQLTRPFSELLKVSYCDLPKYARLYEDLKLSPAFGSGSSSWSDSPWIRYCLGQPELTVRYNKLIIENWLCGGELPRRLQHRIGLSSDAVLDLKAPGSAISGSQLIRMLPLSEHSIASFSDTRDYVDLELARQEALRLSLACQLWFRRHQTFPSHPEELVPEFLRELPVDPFNKLGEPIRYLQDGENVIIYSIGQNETDDRGAVDLVPSNGYPDLGYRLAPPIQRDLPSELSPQ
jgi:hypothetical protein